MEKLGEFKGLVAVVTGGGSGMGKATALLLAERGAQVMIAGRRADMLDAVTKEAAARGLDVRGTVADVASAADVSRLFEATRAGFGGVDILVTAAGAITSGSIMDADEAEWDRVVDVNLKGVYLPSRHAIAEMRRRGGGAIVHVASMHAFASTKGRAVYAATKAGVVGLTRAMALDHAADNIRVNAVCPGAVDTDFLRSGWAALNPGKPLEPLLAELGAKHPAGRIGRPEDVAEVIAFLASPRASFLTGEAYPVEGGVLARLSIAPQVR